MNNEKNKSTIMILAGAYLIYLGGDLVRDVWIDKPENMIWFIIVGVIFVLVGVFVVISKIKLVNKLQQQEMLEAQEDAEEGEGSEEIKEENEEVVNEEVVNEEVVNEDMDAIGKELEHIIDELEDNK